MAARTGDEYLKGLSATARTIWLEDARVTDVLGEPAFAQAARSIADWYDLQHAHPDELLIADPETGEPINISHMQPRSADDLARRHVGLARIAEMTFGMMGRTPDYMNVTFAGFADDPEHWRGPDDENAAGYANLVEFQKRLRRADLALTHTIVHPVINRETDRVFAGNPAPLHKVGETADSIIVRGGRMLATLAPFADEQTVYPGGPLPPDAGPEYALSFTVAMDAPGLIFLCRDSAARPAATRFDAPLSTRFDEQDAYCIFDDVHVPKQNVFIDGSIAAYATVTFASHWWPNVMQQTTIRALTKLEFFYGLLSAMAELLNDRSENSRDLLGEVVTYIEATRNALYAAEARCVTMPNGAVYPEGRALHPIRALMPTWMTRVAEIIRAFGGANLLTTPSRAMLDDESLAPLLDQFLPGALGATPEQRSAVYRMAWDVVGTTLGSRGELYERHYLGSTRKNHLMIDSRYADGPRARGRDLLARALTTTRVDPR